MKLTQIIGLVVRGCCVLVVGCSVKEEEKMESSPPLTSATMEIFEFVQETQTEPCKGRPLIGSIFSVYASPLEHIGKVVRITGYLAVIEREAYLFPSRDYADAVLPQMGISLGLSETTSYACEEGPKRVPTLAGCDRQVVSATGCFSYDGSFSFGVLKGDVKVIPFWRNEQAGNKGLGVREVTSE